MSRLVRLALCAALLPVVLAPRASYAQEETPQLLGQKATEHWLALVDAGKYGESWDEAAQAFKDAVSRATWVEDVQKVRGPLGKVTTRKLVKSDLLKNPPDSPPGDYVGIQYRTSFQHLKSATETVVPMLDKDGKWRVSGYVVKKAPQTSPPGKGSPT